MRSARSRRRGRRRGGDPFAPTADADFYVPRDATEQALFELLRSVRDDERASALVGPPGIGKTLLLRLVAERLRDEVEAVYVANAAMPANELCTWVLGERELPPSDVPVAALLQHARDLHAQGRGLLLLLDDAGAMPVATLTALGRLCAASEGALRMLVACNDAPAVAEAVIDAIGTDTDVVRLLRPMSESETRRYVEARLKQSRAPKRIRACFDARRLASLHAECEGVPREVNSACAELLRTQEPVEEEPRPDPAAEIGGEDEVAADPPSPHPPARRLRAVEPPSSGRVVQTGLILAAAIVAVVLIRAGILVEPAPAPERTRPSARPAAAPAPAELAPDAPFDRSVVGPYRVQINASPWASVEVDGVDVGITPIAGLPLLAGDHRFRARMPDGRVVERTVRVDAERRFVAFE